MNVRDARHSWPDLTGLDLLPTTDALHLWSQVVGKVRLMLTPWINQSWHATFYLSARGFTTGLIHAGADSFEMEFDLLDDILRIDAANGKSQRVAGALSWPLRILPLQPRQPRQPRPRRPPHWRPRTRPPTTVRT